MILCVHAFLFVIWMKTINREKGTETEMVEMERGRVGFIHVGIIWIVDECSCPFLVGWWRCVHVLAIQSRFNIFVPLTMCNYNNSVSIIITWNCIYELPFTIDVEFCFYHFKTRWYIHLKSDPSILYCTNFPFI